MSVEQLDLLCEEEREKRLKPERERLIRKCIENMGKNEEYCTNFYADHGDAVRIDPVHARPALYYDLPACVAARKAREVAKGTSREVCSVGYIGAAGDPPTPVG